MNIKWNPGVAGAIYFTGKYNRIAEKERDNLLIHPFRFLVVTPVLNLSERTFLHKSFTGLAEAGEGKRAI